MSQIVERFALLAFSFATASCGFWNPDPADKLADRIERESRKLEDSDHTSLAFDFVPDPRRAGRSPRFTGDIVIRVAPDRSTGIQGDSTILVSEWFWTTYHNRFVRTPKAMKATKQPGEAFRLVLRKSGNTIDWTDLE